ncbi:2-alkenal reductase (NADP(+)-dependent)-like [Neltuma alba]|uniref:2-alkenal reductase (NADP(+)-dependent)-like n=1 Tax=Neltuma alba TaxID=207710 RepID=UPI0010A31E7F|nr:2-alkenal reductase (NADP(+)-dependent)-like [Prosopis alba]
MRDHHVVESREWQVAAYCPEGVPTPEHLKLRSFQVSLGGDSIPEGHVAIELMFLSVEPYLRATFTGTNDGLFFPQLPLNQVMKTFGIGRVIGSKDSDYKEGDIVLNPSSPIAEYCVTSSHLLRKIDLSNGIALPDYLTSLGVPGFAAWVGVEVVGQPKAGSNVFVSAACSAVGTCAGQLAKLRGCRVIGSTGSDHKVKLIKEEFGYDDGFNYRKESDFDAALSKYCPDGIDFYFDNVGGEMLEAVLNHVNKHAKISLCGMISEYNKVWTERRGIRNLLNMVGKEVKMEGFVLDSYWECFGEFAKQMEDYMKQGKIKTKIQINHGIESFLDSLASLFSSSNVGKVIIQLNT